MTNEPRQSAADPSVDLTPPAWAKVAALILSIGAALTSVFWLYLVLVQADPKIWISSAFGFVSLLTALMAWPIAFGAYRNGFGMAMLVFSGAFATCVMFGYRSAEANLADLAGQAKMWVVAQGAVSAGFVGVGGLVVLLRKANAWRRLALGIGFMIPIAAIAAVALKKRDWLSGANIPAGGDATAELLRITAIVVGALVLLICLSAAGHWLIRAFEAGRPDDDAPPAA